MSYSLPIVIRVVCAAVCVTLVAVQPALSQATNPRRPSGGLFGGTRSDTGGSERLTVTFEAAEGYDSQLPVERGAIVSGGLSSSGFSTLFGGSASFTHGSRHWQVVASASTAFKYYQELERLDALSHGASVGVGLQLPKSGRLEINEALAYSPSYLYQLFPQAGPPTLGESIPLNPDYQIDQTNSYSSVTRATLGFGSRRGTSLSSFAEYQVSKYQDDSAALDGLETKAAGMNVSHSVSRNASFVAGYSYRTGEVGFSGPSHEHEMPIGIEYSLALSASRRLAFRGQVAPAWLKIAPSDLVLATSEPVPGYVHRIQGNATVSYPFKLNWSAEAAYDRGVQYVMGLDEPLLSDSVFGGVTGLLSRRLDVRANAGFARAVSAQSGTREQLHTYTGGVKVRYGFKRSVAAYSEYLYYYYDQRGQLSLAPGLPRTFEQHGVRFGVAMFVEALGRQGR